MTPYFIFFSIFAFLSLKPFDFDEKLSRLVWTFIILIGTLFIGLRHEVGGDWINYVENIRFIEDNNYSDWLDFTKFDIGYQLLAFAGSRFGMGIYGANLLSGLIVMSCIAYFARRQPYPWISMMVAVPFFIIAVNMGTIRQGLAVSISLVALTQLDKSRLKYFLIILLAFFFHKSALVMFGLLFVKNIRIYTLLFLIALLYIFFMYLVTIDAYETLLMSYLIEPDYQSDGALIRLGISLVPTIAMFLFYKDLNRTFPDTWIYLWFGIATIVLITMTPTLSTLADRLAYYTIPIQFAIWPRIIAIQKNELIREYFAMCIILAYLLILFVWLNFANHAFAWIPYDIIWFKEGASATSKLCYHHWCSF